MPGKCYDYVVIARNMEQWRRSIDYKIEDMENKGPPLEVPKSKKMIDLCQISLLMCSFKNLSTLM